MRSAARRTTALLCAALTLSALAGASPSPAGLVLVLGDSYVSGEGLLGSEPPCGRAPEAWAPQAVSALAERTGAGLSVVSLACSGASVADLTVGGPLGRPAQLAEAATDGLAAGTVLLTVGGNDLGFVELVADCLGIDDIDLTAADADTAAADLGGPTWSSILDSGVAPSGCDATPGQLDGRVRALAEPTLPVDASTTGTLADVYARVAAEVVVPDGELVVVGYPPLFAEPSTWPARYGRRCHGLTAPDAAKVRAASLLLDAVQRDEVARAGTLVGDRTITYVSLVEAFAAQPGQDHSLCGGGEAWVNGLMLVEGGLDVSQLLVSGVLEQLVSQGAPDGEATATGLFGGEVDLQAIGARPGGSFHPSTVGHAAIADLVADVLEDALAE